MSNILKGYWVSVDDDTTKVVDSNELADRRIQEEQEKIARLSYIMDVNDEPGEFVEGLSAEKLDVLMNEEAENAVLKTANQEELERVNAEIAAAKDELAAVREEAQMIIEKAHNEAEEIKAEAFESASAQGYEAGREQALGEVEAMKAELEEQSRQLMAEYEEMVSRIEPMIVEKLTDIYEHIFHVNLSEYRGLVSSLIIDALNNSDGAKSIIIHVSKEDYPNVIEMKDEILTQTGTMEQSLEIIQDGAMAEGACLVETENGVFDCSVDTYMSELKRKLKIISYKN